MDNPCEIAHWIRLSNLRPVTMSKIDDFTTIPKRTPKSRKKVGLFVPDAQVFSRAEKLSPYLLDKLAQLSHSLKINDLSIKSNFCNPPTFSIVTDPVLSDLFGYYFPPRFCNICRVPIITRVKIERFGQPAFWKKILPRPKIVLGKKTHYDYYLETPDNWEKDAQIKSDNAERKYKMLHLPDKQETTRDNLTIDKQILFKKAKAKHFTHTFVNALTEIDSPLNEGYKRTLDCASQLIQNNDKLTGKYCKNRWCIICNRIRAAQLINGYSPILDQFEEPQFVTLTIPNMSADKLQRAISGMQFAWREVYRMIKRPKYINYDFQILGLKKIECTYNPEMDSFHPHFHFVIDTSIMANLILNTWLAYWKKGNPPMYQSAPLSRDAQNIKPIDKEKKGYLELFKYFTKVITKANDKDNDAIYIQPMDVIFQAMQRRRTFEPLGIKKVSEDINEIQAEYYSHLAHETKIWTWFEKDWICGNEGLTGHNPDGTRLDNLLKKIVL